MRLLEIFKTMVLLSVIGCTGAAADEQSPPTRVENNAVVLELFTSQGCSSCPAADRLIRKLAADPALQGRIIPLSFHVDYWNYIGWSDPFSSALWSKRQKDYAAAFPSSRVYTPQLVVNGTSELTGSHEAGARREIDKAFRRAPGVRLDVVPVWSDDAPGSIAIAVRATILSSVGSRKLLVVAALYENGLTTAVRRGENSGRSLENDFVVRRLEVIGRIASAAVPAFEKNFVLAADKGWKRDRLGVAVFVQDEQSREILGAVAMPVPAS